MQNIDKSIIVKASEGDFASFEQIYRVYSGFVYNIALRFTRGQEDAAEVTQDVFMAVYRKLKSFEFKSSFRTWIYRITANLAINRIKKLSRQRQGRSEYNDSIVIGITPSEHDENIEKEERQAVINKMLDLLNPEQRICITLRHIEGLSYEEIAETLKVNINTVRTRLKRAREKLLAARKEVVTNEV